MAYKEVENNLEWWAPSAEGAEMEGVVSKVAEGEYGSYVVLNTLDGSRMGTPSHRMLQNLLDGLHDGHGPEIGDKIKIVFTGTEKSGKGKDTMKYKVFIDE